MLQRDKIRRYEKICLTLIGLVVFSSLAVLPLYAGKLIDKSSQRYFLYLPKTLLDGEKSPVLVCLPGWGVQAKQDINMWTYPAEKHGFIVINLDVDYNLMRSQTDVQALYQRIMKVISSLAVAYPIDTQRIYIAGTSAGGMMSISLALMFPNRFAAVCVVSGARLGFSAEDNIKNAKNCRFYLVHGDQDKSIPIGEFHSTKRQLEKHGAAVEFKIIPEGAHTLPSFVYKEVLDWLSGTAKSE